MKKRREDATSTVFDPESLRRRFDRPEVALAYLFGSAAGLESHGLSDIDLAYLGVDAVAEDRVFDELYESIQQELGEGCFDLVPLRRAPLHLQFVIATEGKPLFVRNPAIAEAFGARAIVRYLDFKPIRDRYFASGARSMVADRQKVEDRIDRVRRFKRDLEEFARISREDFRVNRERQHAVLHALQNAIEGCLEIASHILSADRLGAPADYASMFTLLETHGVIPSSVADSMRRMARFRNRIVHLYWDLDLDLVYEYLTSRLTDFDSYLSSIEGYLG